MIFWLKLCNVLQKLLVYNKPNGLFENLSDNVNINFREEEGFILFVYNFPLHFTEKNNLVFF